MLIYLFEVIFSMNNFQASAYIKDDMLNLYLQVYEMKTLRGIDQIWRKHKIVIVNSYELISVACAREMCFQVDALQVMIKVHVAVKLHVLRQRSIQYMFHLHKSARIANIGKETNILPSCKELTWSRIMTMKDNE